MSDSGGDSDGRDRRNTRKVSHQKNRSTGSPRAGVSPSKKNFTHAKCINSHIPTTKDQLQLEKDDVLLVIKKLYGHQFKIWEGQNLRTGRIGYFNEDDVQFFEGPPPKTQEVPRTKPNISAGESNDDNLIATYRIAIFISVFAGLVLSLVFGLDKYVWKTSRGPVNITELEGIFKSQDPDIWDTLRAGLLPSKTEQVKTFLFVHAKDGPTTECLIKKISNNYCTVYRAGELNFHDSFVSKAKSRLQEIKCMVIYDLENLAAEGITVLKGFCDAYTPIVPQAEFYFALDTGEPPVSSNVKKVARQKLETMWSEKSSHDDFGGTVTRLTQNVLRVTGEDELPC